MHVATWNINNVRKRLDVLLDWLERAQPDVVALQELKTPGADFPAKALAAAGYQSLVVGQRAWNGVALLARGHEPLAVVTSLPGDPKDKEARYVEAAINGVLFASLYLPNGNPCPGPKFDFKLAWFQRMRQRAQALWDSGQPVVLMGDWNVVPTDADIYKPDTWRDNALLQPEPREQFAAVLAQGWTDALESVHPGGKQFTFWDYRRKRWERNAGLRIDHILVSAALKVQRAGVDREERGREDASDHAPVWAELTPAKAKRASRTASKPIQPASSSTKTREVSAPLPDGNAPLARYNAKRDFSKTAEPAGTPRTRTEARGQGLAFVIQKHWASRLHYDLRLELDGVMVSWAVPKGPSYDPAVKQMAIHVEDHPIDYNSFEGSIPKGEYGGGKVIVWDQGTWEPVGDAREGLAKGKLIFHLHGQKLAGLWELVRISKPGAKKQDRWLLLKKRGDAWARPSTEYDVIKALPDSINARPLGLVEEREPQRVRVPALKAPSSADMQLARRAPLPAKLQPQLATLVSSVPQGNWIVESKFDGYRLLARVDRVGVRLFTRNGHDWTDKLEPIAQAIAALGLDTAWLDGEIVVLNDAGLPDFNRLQNAIDNSRTQDVEMFVFDLPYLDGMDLREVPLASRRPRCGSSSRNATKASSGSASPSRSCLASCWRPLVRWAWKGSWSSARTRCTRQAERRAGSSSSASTGRSSLWSATPTARVLPAKWEACSWGTTRGRRCALQVPSARDGVRRRRANSVRCSASCGWASQPWPRRTPSRADGRGGPQAASDGSSPASWSRWRLGNGRPTGRSAMRSSGAFARTNQRRSSCANARRRWAA